MNTTTMDGFSKIIHMSEARAVVAHDCGWLFVDEARTEGARRHAEVTIAEMMPDGMTYKSRHKVCDVYFDTKGYGEAATYKGEVNWSAWGSQDSETTKRFAECLLVATELTEAFANGFTFLWGPPV